MTDISRPGENRDIEQMPTPGDPEKRDVVQRIEVNARSLKLLCEDVASFMDRAEDESLKPANERDEKIMETTRQYFERMYALLARINNDIAGHGYTSSSVRPPLQPSEVEQGMLEDLRQSFLMIEEALQMANRQSLIPDASNRGEMPNETADLFPFGTLLRDIEDTVRGLKRIFRME